MDQIDPYNVPELFRGVPRPEQIAKNHKHDTSQNWKITIFGDRRVPKLKLGGQTRRLPAARPPKKEMANQPKKEIADQPKKQIADQFKKGQNMTSKK